MGCRPGRHSSSKFRIFPGKFYKTKNKFSDISLFNRGFQKEEAEFNKFSTTTKTYNYGHRHEMITVRLSTDGSTLQIEKNDEESCLSTPVCSSRSEIVVSFDNDSLDSYSSNCKSEPLLSKNKHGHQKQGWSDPDINQSNDLSTDDECEWYTADSKHSSATTTATVHVREDNSPPIDKIRQDGEDNAPCQNKNVREGAESSCRNRNVKERADNSSCKHKITTDSKWKRSKVADAKFTDVTLTPNLSKLSAEYITHLSEQILVSASTHLALQTNGLNKYSKTCPETPKKKRKSGKQFLKIPARSKKYLARFSESGDISFFSKDELTNIKTKI